MTLTVYGFVLKLFVILAELLSFTCECIGFYIMMRYIECFYCVDWD